MKTTLMLTLLVATLPAFAVTQQDVEFAQRQCQQREDPIKCQVARDLARTYQREQRDRMEYDAAIKSRRPMAGSNNVDINVNNGYSNYQGEYRWNHARRKYCYHNRSGSVNHCVN